MNPNQIESALRAPITQVLHQHELEVDHVLTLPRFRDAASLREFLLETCTELFEDGNFSNEGIFLISTRKRSHRSSLEPSSSPSTSASPKPADPTEQTAPQIRDNSGTLNLPFLLQNAEVLLQAGENDLARKILNKLARKSEIAGLVHRLFARSYQGEGDTSRAIQHLRESLVHESSPEVLESLATLLIRSNNEIQALEFLQRLLAESGLSLNTRLDVLNTSGNICTRLEKLDEAQSYYLQGLELTGDRDLRFLNNLASLYLRQARIGTAIETFHRSLDLNETQPNAHYGLASAYLAAGNLKLALDHFAESLEIKLDQPHVLYQLIRCAHQLNSHSTAARILADYIDEVSSTPSLNYTLAGLQFYLGRQSECATSVAKILMVQPHHTGALALRERIRKISSEKKFTL